MRIGELAAELGVTSKTIRFYESSGLLPAPERTPAGYRLYGPQDVERLTFIKSAQRLGLSLDDIREILAFRDQGELPCHHVRHLLTRQAADIQRRIKELQALRDQLIDLESRTHGLSVTDTGYCAILSHTPHEPTADGRIPHRADAQS